MTRDAGELLGGGRKDTGIEIVSTSCRDSV
jgi:hypothetical protein